MNESLLELLQRATLYDLIITIFLISIIAGIILSQKKKIIEKLNKWRKTKNEEENFDDLVYSLRDSVADMKKTIDKQSDDIKNLTTIVVEMQKINSKTKRAEIKEKIERIYSECHPAMTCTDMQFEVLKELIEEYEEHGGVNSFVHSAVEPEMHEWTKIGKIKSK